MPQYDEFGMPIADYELDYDISGPGAVDALLPPEMAIPDELAGGTELLVEEGTPMTPQSNELNLDGVIAPKGESLPGAAPTKDDELAAARVVLGTAQPAQMVDKVVGKTSSTTSQVVQSDASKAASAGLEAAQQKAQQATDMEMQAAKDQAMIEAEISEKDNRVISTIENARAEVQMENQAKFQSALADIDSRVAELSNFKPETFWGSKSTSDKVAAALSVGLGAYSQALLGSGQNIGQVLLERSMGEFDRNQQAQYNNRLKQIEAMKASLETKRDLADDAEKTFDAQKLAARAQVQSQNAKALAMAKTPQVQAAIQQRQAKLDADIAGKQAEIASKYEQKISSTTENDIIKKIPMVAGNTRDGKPLNVDQSKALGFYNQMSQSLKNIAKFDEQALVKRGSVGKYMRDIEYNTASGNIPVIGKALDAGRVMIGDTAEDRVKKADPEAYNYVQQAQGFVNAILRKESGASIADPEFQRTYKQYFPQANDGPEEVKEKAERRRQAAEDVYTATGM